MLQKIAGKNFEGYEKLEMEFHPGVNVIIGQSDAGKSAAFNLIKWIRTNRPLGNAYRSEWGGDTEGEIWTTDGHHIKRLKEDGDETTSGFYIIDGVKLKAGATPPDEVFAALRLDDINIQEQEEPAFMLAPPWSPGEVAKLLNKAASIEDIDISVANLTKGLKNANQTMGVAEAVLKSKQVELERYVNLPDIEKQIVEIEQSERYKIVLTNQRNALQNIQQNLNRIALKLEQYNTLPGAEILLKELKTHKALYVELETKTITLRQLSNRLKKVEEGIAEVKDLSTAQSVITEAGKLWKTQQELEKKKTGLAGLKKRLDLIKKEDDSLKRQMDAFQKEYDELLPDVCPLCGGDTS